MGSILIRLMWSLDMSLRYENADGSPIRAVTILEDQPIFCKKVTRFFLHTPTYFVWFFLFFSCVQPLTGL